MMAERLNANWACLVNCLGNEGRSAAAELLSELTGRPMKAEDCSCVVPWQVDNKYYSAQVQFVVCSHSGTEPEEREWEALLLLFNLAKPDSLEVATNTWERVEKQGVPPICLLVGATGAAGEPSCRQQAMQWCVGHGFELIEWDREPQPSQNGGGGDESEEDDFPESTGIERMSEALQAHVWPDMTMKSGAPGERSSVHTTANVVDTTGEVKQDESQPGEEKGVLSKHTSSSISATAAERDSSQRRIDHLLSEEEELLASGLSDEQDPGGESFEKLFSRFAQMKAHAESLPHEERKDYAEKVVMAFWKAVGGEEEEVVGVEEDS